MGVRALETLLSLTTVVNAHNIPGLFCFWYDFDWNYWFPYL